MSTVLWIDELHDGCVPEAGAKIARLGELRRIGLTVPEGFVVTTDAYQRFLAHTGLQDTIAAHLGRVTDPADQEQLEVAADAIRDAVLRAPFPEQLAESVVDAYEDLSHRCYELNIPVAVRSSAVGEDAGETSFAGQFDTYLGISGPERLLASVRSCWASRFSARSLTYCLEKGSSPHDCPMAVGVIKLVHARASGVAFSSHPVTGKSDRMVLEGSWGWGEAVVQGRVVADHVEVGKSDRRVLDYRVSHKSVVSAFDYSTGAVCEVEMPKGLQDEKAINDEQIEAIVDTVLVIEDHYGFPVDVEWVIDRHRRPGDAITIVQTRPETVHVGDGAPGTAAARWDPVEYASKYAFGRNLE